MVGIGKVKKTTLHIEEPSFLEIVGKAEDKVFEVDKDGKVFWLKDGKFTQAKMDTDLALAFMVAVMATSGFEYPALIKKIRESGEQHANKI